MMQEDQNSECANRGTVNRNVVEERNEYDEEEQQHDQLPTVDEILVERGQGKIISSSTTTSTSMDPFNDSSKKCKCKTCAWRVSKGIFVVLLIASVFAVGFWVGNINKNNDDAFVPPFMGDDYDYDFFDPAASVTLSTPGVERHYITKSGLINKGYAIFGGMEFEDPENYQSLALEVLLQNGVLIHDPNDQRSGSDYQKLAQRYALLCLYYSTNNVRTHVTDEQFGVGMTPSWHNKDAPSPWKFNWEDDECDWSGVVCDNDSKLVTRIELVDHLLTGYLPTELKLLNAGPIQVLDFSNNRGLGEGGFPLVFSEFDSLESIGLQGTSFVGMVPEDLCEQQTIKHIFVDCNDVACECCDSCSGRGD